jgi:hypothetical protein
VMVTMRPEWIIPPPPECIVYLWYGSPRRSVKAR